MQSVFDNTQLMQSVPSASMSGAAYWIQLCTYEQQALFGGGCQEALHLTEAGAIIADEWQRLAGQCQGLQLEDWMVMPDSVQGILILSTDRVRSQNFHLTAEQPPRRLSSFVASFKAASATRVNLLRNLPGERVWQSGYQQHCLKDRPALQRARQHLIGMAA